MATGVYSIKRNDTAPAIRAALLDAKGVVDLTNATVRFLMRPVLPQHAPVLNASASVVDNPAKGVVEYQWVVGDTAIAGAYYAEWEVTRSDLTVVTFPSDDYLEVRILADLG